MGARASAAQEVAVVTYAAPQGTEAAVLAEGQALRFGRSADCEIRIGFAPEADIEVPRVAGRLIASNGRVVVESGATSGHRAIEVQLEDRRIQVAIGEAWSPPDPKFQVCVRTSTSLWKLEVTTRSEQIALRAMAGIDVPTSQLNLELNGRQQLILNAYFEPIRRGKAEPATHREVAAALNYHPNTVRDVLYEIWALMFEQGVPMIDVSDKRVAVVEAARVHGLYSRAN